MKEYYDAISKRKSVRKYDTSLKVTPSELKMIEEKISTLTPLFSNIQTKIELVPVSETTAKRGEWCILLYSEKKNGYLENSGYLLEQIDLFLAQNFLGACWYGLAKARVKEKGSLSYTIMISFGKSAKDDFRNSIRQFDRKEKSEICSGEVPQSISEIVRLSPSACNSQPWFIRAEGGKLTIFRNTKTKAIMTKSMARYFNSIDMGIFLFILEVALEKEEIEFKGTMFTNQLEADGKIKIAEYEIENILDI